MPRGTGEPFRPKQPVPQHEVDRVFSPHSRQIVEQRTNTLFRNVTLTDEELAHAKKHIKDAINAVDREYRDEEIPLDPELAPLLTAVDQAFDTYFTNLGITLPSFQPRVTFLKAGKNIQQEGKTQGFSRPRAGYVALYDELVEVDTNHPRYEEAKRLRLYHLATTYAHERYHGFAKSIFYYNPTKPYLEYQREGLQVFSTKQLKFGSALEEGMAQRVSYEIAHHILRPLFPDLNQIWYEALSKHQLLGNDGLPLPREAIHISLKPDGLEIGSVYPNSIRLNIFLEKSLPNFRTLLEKARIEGELLGLIRKMEATFGRPTLLERMQNNGYTSQVLLRNEKDADKALAWLQKRKPFLPMVTTDSRNLFQKTP